MTGRTSLKRGGLHEPLVMGAIMQEQQYLTLCRGGWSFNVHPDATAGRSDEVCASLSDIQRESIVIVKNRNIIIVIEETYCNRYRPQGFDKDLRLSVNTIT
ncbi:hypothetical protein AVEN_112642-1 [Araneus ventricosus]|uniref:Uncharacterized protein n=1 Tax=Araneus ventricosus TaxID=182803 RepID=A0A4Y2VGN0_ARAVE|nr:hypothetical protein AVEN_78853-1 [Araneus ventricosus]GBO23464.1 hypothetical protein AVEN_112642-1 [Araneus ventricosus]